MDIGGVTYVCICFDDRYIEYGDHTGFIGGLALQQDRRNRQAAKIGYQYRPNFVARSHCLIFDIFIEI
jgi:hypothetical protein